MKILDNYLSKRKLKREKELYNKGFDYAAGELLRQAPTEDVIQELQSHVDCAVHFDDYDEFDHGIDDAIDRAIKLGIAKHVPRDF